MDWKRRAAAWIACAGVVFGLAALNSCSQRNLPTGPGPTPTPGTGQPVVLTAANHPAGWASSQCLFCHQPADLPYHANLTENQCPGCHGDNGTSPGYELCVVCHGNPPAGVAHAEHMALTGFGVQCSTCHTDAGIDNAARHRDGRVQVNVDRRFGGQFVDPTCVNVYCHGIGRPNWDRPVEPACTDCHDARGSVPIGPKSGQHPLHAGGSFNCLTCHEGAPSTHWNGKLDNPDRIRPDNGVYQDQTPNGFSPDGTSGTCSSLTSPCHSGSSPWRPGQVCGSCHPATVNDPPTQGSHPEHVAQQHFDCRTCHAEFPADHINGSVNVQFNAAGLPGPGASWRDPSCVGVYCHGGGTLAGGGGAGTQPIWGNPSTVYCGSCHGAPGGPLGYPASGKHVDHVRDFGYDCSDCHNQWPTGHVNGIRDVVFDRTFLTDARFQRAPQPNLGTCTSIVCHYDYPTGRQW